MRVMGLSWWLVPPRLAIGAALVGIAVLISNIIAVALGDGLLLANNRLVAGDFMAFWSAGRMTLDGDLALIHTPRPIYEAQLAAVPGLDVVYYWHHPPTFLLIATALAALPYLVAAGVFLGTTSLAYGAAARGAFRSGYPVLFAFCAPAAAMHFGNVQTGLLTAALVGGAMLVLPKRPLAAGVLVGLMAIKPHLAVLFPLAFIAGGRWKAFFAAAATAILLCAAAYFAFGWGAFERFFTNMGRAQGLVTELQIAAGTYATLFGNLMGLKVPLPLAAAAHGFSALAAATLVWMTWRRGDWPLAGAVLAAASTLISPYLFFYDLTLLLVSIVLIVRAVGWEGLSAAEKCALIFAWAAPGLIFTLGAYVPAPFAAVGSWAVLWVAARRALRD
jgi:Glycosyltransferase family 87